jgi:5-methylcytosine-specific restriction endonuclease McrA
MERSAVMPLQNTNNHMDVEEEPVKKRKAIPKRIRDRVWRNAFGDELKGTCVCCNDVITVLTWECAHINAHKLGGEDAENNLLPTCKSCNRSMGTENLWEFKARCYP